MALEDLTGAKYLDSLVVGNPVSTDDRREGDDHIRGIKNVLRNTFPNLNGPVTATDEQLNSSATPYLPLAGGTVTGALVAAGGVTLGDAADDALTINSNTVSIPNNLNFSGGNVGINAPSPVSFAGYRTVEARGTAAGGGGLFRATTGDGSVSADLYVAAGKGYVGSFTNHPFSVMTNGVERVFLDVVGNVGVAGPATVYGADVRTLAMGGAGINQVVFDLNVAGTNTGFVTAVAGRVMLGSRNASTVEVFTNNQQRVLIEAAGVASFLFGTKTQRTWQAVGASRNFNQDYTAPAYDIELSSTNTTTANSQTLELVVNGVSVASDFNAGATNTCIRLHGHVIPAGATYRINATANISKVAWSELR